MSRIIYPANFIGQRTLFGNIAFKHNNDKANSDIAPLLLQKNINLTKASTASTNAQAQEDIRLLLTKQSQNYSQLRDIQFNPIFTRLKQQVQFLKGLFKPNFKQLGNWGITIDNNGKITYPADFAAQVALFTTFKETHDAFDAGTSPLQPFLTVNKIDLVAEAALVSSAVTNHKKFAQAAKDAETATEQRDLHWLPVEKYLHEIGDYLKKLYIDNTKALGLWGYVVDTSPVAPKERTSTLKVGEKVTLSGIVLGSLVTNIGTADVHIYKGRSTTGNPIIVHAGENDGVAKGFTTITVSNPSTTATAKVKTLIS
jgi:hypothetical protein